MMKTKAQLVLFVALMTEALWACPSCAGSMQNEKDIYTVMVLGIFILVIYIPFFILFRMIVKNKNSNLMPVEK